MYGKKEGYIEGPKQKIKLNKVDIQNARKYSSVLSDAINYHHLSHFQHTYTLLYMRASMEFWSGWQTLTRPYRTVGKESFQQERTSTWNGLNGFSLRNVIAPFDRLIIARLRHTRRNRGGRGTEAIHFIEFWLTFPRTNEMVRKKGCRKFGSAKASDGC